MNRALGLAALLLVAGVLAGCAAGAPGAGPVDADAVAQAAPTATAAQVAAIRSITRPSPTALPPTATAAPSPTPAATVASPTEPAATTTDAPGFGGRIEQPMSPEQTQRPAPPPPPDDGLSIVMPDPTTLESPLFGDDPTELQVALTFDAGADRGYAAEILDVLADYGIKASFGMTGQWAEANPDLVQRMVNEGHMLFNHTWDHGSLTGANTGQPPMTAEEVAQQVGDTEAVVRDLTGYDMKPYFRPPYGDYSNEALGYLADNGYYITVWWTCDTRGWDGWTASQINDYCTVNLKPHEIILLHVGAGGAGAEGDLAALPGMIASFREQGYEFVTVEEMLQP